MVTGTKHSTIVPIKTKRGGNNREHHFARHQRVQREKDTTRVCLLEVIKPTEFPVTIKLTRISPGKLDDDNLVGSLKSIRDAVAAWIGVDDKHVHKVRYVYDQENAGRAYYAVRIEVIHGQQEDSR